MRRSTLVLLCLYACLSASCGSGSGTPPAPTFTVLSPNGGEVWPISTVQTVTWTSSLFAGAVDIDLSTNGGATWSALVANTANDGTEDVTVPATATHQARVRVGAADGDPSLAGAPSDDSDGTVRIDGGVADLGAGLPGVLGSLAWGDYDNDGDLDLALAGDYGEGLGARLCRIYRNDGGTLTDIEAGLPGVELCSLAWGDYDNDGDLDLALAGSAGQLGLCRIYRNDGGTFNDLGAGLPELERCSLAWGDYDNDGDLDLALAGWSGGELETPSSRISRIYRNDGGTFTDLGAGLPGVSGCSLAWGDYDSDGDLDLALAGGSDAGVISRIYRNDGGTFTDLGAGLPGVREASLAWGDYDNDGDLDLALAGRSSAMGPISLIYRNDEGTFTDLGAHLLGVDRCSLAWGDYDNDGDLDLALAGWSGGTSVDSRIFRNDAGTFTDLGAGLPGVMLASLAWGDYDSDGDLDLALAGLAGGEGGSLARIYRNDGGFAPNTPPSAPADVIALAGGGEVLLSWLPAVDLETPEEGLSYNLRVGKTTSDDGDYPSMADELGVRRIPARGPITDNPLFVSAWLSLPSGVYYASVQAIDSSLEGGPWSEPVAFAVP